MPKADKTANKRKGLEVWINRRKLHTSELCVAIPLDVLKAAAERSEAYNESGEQGGSEVRVSDESEFAKSVIKALMEEGEDGSTLLTRMFDSAFEWVLERGEDGVDYADENED